MGKRVKSSALQRMCSIVHLIHHGPACGRAKDQRMLRFKPLPANDLTVGPSQADGIASFGLGSA